MGRDDDFFGGYVAPGLLVGGVGVSLHRTAKEIQARGTVSNRWKARADQKGMMSKLKAHRAAGTRYETGLDDILNSLYPDVSRYKKHGGVFNLPEINDAYHNIRGMAVNKFLTAFDLHNEAIARGVDINNLGAIDREKLKELAELSPKNRMFLEKVSRGYGLMGLVNLPNAPADVEHKLGVRAQKLGNTLLESNKAFSHGRTLKEFINSKPALRSSLSYANRTPAPLLINSDAELKQALAGFEHSNKGELLTKTHKLFQQTQNAGMDFKLTRVMESGRMIHTGIRVEGNKKFGPMNLPFVQNDGSVRMGFYGQEKRIARRVPTEEIFEFMRGGKDLTISQTLDLGLLDHASENFDRFTTTGDWKSLMTNITSKWDDDVGRLLVPYSINPTLNRKYASQVRLEGNTFGINLDSKQIGAVDERAIEEGLAWGDGVSPTQRVGGVRMFPHPDRALGASAFGAAIGDDKTLAQEVKPKIANSRTRQMVFGKAQLETGDLSSFIRTYSAEQSQVEAIVALSSRPDIGVHEDTMILFDKGITYREEVSKAVQGSSVSATHLESLLENTAFRKAVTSSTGAFGVIEQYKESERALLDQGYEKSHPFFQAMRDQRKELEGLIRLTPEHIIGELPQGGYKTAATTGDLLVDRIGFLNQVGPTLENEGEDTSRLLLKGHLEERAKDGDKFFGTKRVINGEFSGLEGRFHSTLLEALKTDSEVISLTGAMNEARELRDPEAYSRHLQSLKNVYKPFVDQFHDEWFDQGAENLNLNKFTPHGIEPEVWQRAMALTSGTQALETQGFKKIGERTLEFVTEGLAEELTREHSRLQKYENRKLEGLKRNLGNHIIDAEGNVSLQYIPEKVKAAREQRNYIEATLARAGVMRQDGRFVVDEAKANLVNSFDELLLGTSEEGTPHRVKRWSMTQALESVHGQGWAAGQSEADLRAAMQSILKDKEKRTAIFENLQGQLQHGAYNKRFAPEGDPRPSTGSGKPGSFNMQMAGHMKEQGGVMEDLSHEFLARLDPYEGDEAGQIYKRLGSYYEGVGKDVETVSMKQVVDKFRPKSHVVEGIFGRNQAARSRAFADIRTEFGLKKSDHLLFDLGDGKQIYHPEEISKHTGGFITSEGKKTISDIDRATKDLFEGFYHGNTEKISTAREAYELALRQITIGKKQSPIGMLSGKVQGSLRGQARPGIPDDFFDFAGMENYKHGVGIKEASFERMHAEMGQVDDYAERLALLREGKEAAIIARQPGTELHRVSSINIFSIDEAMKRYTTAKTSGMTSTGVEDLFEKLDPSKYKKARAAVEEGGEIYEGIKAGIVGKHADRVNKFQEDLATAQEYMAKATTRAKKKAARKGVRKAEIGLEKQLGIMQGEVDNIQPSTHNYWKELYSSALIDKHADHAAWIPEQALQILGADFDNDQIDLLLGRDKEFMARLRERANFQKELITKRVSIDDANVISTSAAHSREEKLAAQDYIYKTRQRELYAGLKAHKGGVLSAEDLEKGSKQWQARQRSTALMAEFEKGYIGTMTNATDFTRQILRQESGVAHAEGRLFSEMLLGIMPETALKARQAGAQGLTEIRKGGGSMGESITTLHNILTGQMNDLSHDQLGGLFNKHFRNVHSPTGTSELVEKMLASSTTQVINAVKTAPSTREENLLANHFRRKAEKETPETMQKFLKRLFDPNISSFQSEHARSSVEGLGISRGSRTQTNIKTAALTFQDAMEVLKRNKGPALMAAAAAIGTSLILSSPNNISAEEAEAAGARHAPSSPTMDAPGFDDSAPVSTGNGRQIRIRGSSSGNADVGNISAMLQEKYPGADLSYTMNDYRERINEEYLRKRLSRG